MSRTGWRGTARLCHVRRCAGDPGAGEARTSEPEKQMFDTNITDETGWTALLLGLFVLFAAVGALRRPGSAGSAALAVAASLDS